MKTQPFAIRSAPAGDTYWVVVPSPDLESIQLCLDLGGGTGPVVANVEWVRQPTMTEGGFLCWTVNGQLHTATPEWVPRTLVPSIEDMARTLLELQRRKRSEA